jgi:hypothetical protein
VGESHLARELGLENDEETKETLRNVIRDALQCFSDLLEQIEGMETEPPVDTYAWETMSESLVRFLACQLAKCYLTHHSRIETSVCLLSCDSTAR